MEYSDVKDYSHLKVNVIKIYKFEKGKDYHRNTFKEVQETALPMMQLIKHLHHTFTAMETFHIEVVHNIIKNGTQ